MEVVPEARHPGGNTNARKRKRLGKTMDAQKKILALEDLKALEARFKFRHVNVWDNGVRVMMIEYRVVEVDQWSHPWHFRHGLDSMPEMSERSRNPYMLEIIVNGTCGLGLHYVDDCIDGKMELGYFQTWKNRNLIGRYVYDGVGDGLGDDFEISNSRCMVTIRVNRNEQLRLVHDVVGELIIVPGTNGDRSYRRPILAV